MSEMQAGMITFKDLGVAEKLDAIRQHMQQYGNVVVCENDTKKPVYLAAQLQSFQPLKEVFLANDPMVLGFTLIRDFVKLYGVERTQKLMTLRNASFDALKRLEVTSHEADNSIAECFDHMKDLLSQMSDFNNM